MIAGVWVYVPTWLVQDGEIPELAAGARLRSVGLRLVAAGLRAAVGAADGVVWVAQPDQNESAFGYEVTGAAGVPRDVHAHTGRPESGGAITRVGAEFSLTAQEQGFVVLAPGAAADYRAGDRLTVRGALWVVAGYEWDAFGLPDLRRDWRINAVKAEHGSAGEVTAVLDLNRMRRWDDDTSSPPVTVDYVVDLSPVPVS
jgi:hypothetical protein